MKSKSNEKFSIGDKIKIIHLYGENTDYDNREGVIDFIDSIGQLHGTWGGLGVLPEVDKIILLGDKTNPKR